MALNPAVLHHANYSSSIVIAHRATSAGSTVLPQQLNAWLNASQLVVKMADFDRDGDLDYQCLDYRGVNVTKGDDFAPFPTRPCYMCRCDRITRDLVHGLMCDEKFCPSCLSLTRPAYDACCAKTCIYMYIAGAAILSMLIGLCVFGIWQNMRRWRNNGGRLPPYPSDNNTATQNSGPTCAAGIPVFVFHRADGMASVVHPQDGTSTLHTIYSPNNNTSTQPYPTARHQPNYAAFLHPSQLATVSAGVAVPTHTGTAEDEEQRQAPPSYWTVLSSDIANRRSSSDQASSNAPVPTTMPMMLVRRGDTANKPETSPLEAVGGLPSRPESPPPKYEDLVLSTSHPLSLPPSDNHHVATSSSSR